MATRPKRITIAIPNRDDFKAEMVMSLMQIITQTGGLVNLVGPQTCYIDDARNQCWDDAKAFDSDWLLFLDSDNNFNCTFNVFERMTSLGKDIVSGIYVMRVHPYRPLVYDFTEDGLIKNITEIPTEPFTRDATGCGLLLISRKVMEAFTPEVEEKIGRPFNFLNYGKYNMLREDPAFCWRVKQLGFELWFDPSITMGHIGKHTFTLEHFENAKQMCAISDAVSDGGISGWMTDVELEFLKTRAQECDTVAEIGSWKGRSTKTLLETGAYVTAIDHWKGTKEIEAIAETQDVYSEFMQNVGNFSNLTVMKMSSLEASASLNGDKFDMVFIDAAHDYKNVKADIEAWLPRATKLICGHDYSRYFPDVIQVVNEKFKGRVKTKGTIWYVELQEVENGVA